MNSLVWAWATKNCVCITCWTLLAVAFGKWWIALFALLFMSDLKGVKVQKEGKDIE